MEGVGGRKHCSLNSILKSYAVFVEIPQALCDLHFFEFIWKRNWKEGGAKWECIPSVYP